ncbi:hypothetical protein NDI47_21425 [Microcoleus vaginatus GB1-A2]
MLSEIRSRVRSRSSVWLSCNGFEGSDRLNGTRIGYNPLSPARLKTTLIFYFLQVPFFKKRHRICEKFK